MTWGIRRLLNSFAFLGMVYDVRHGENEEQVRIALLTEDGRMIGSYPIPLSALDDLSIVIDELKARRISENTEMGFTQELRADRGLRRLGMVLEVDALREAVRESYAEAARRTTQPEDMPGSCES